MKDKKVGDTVFMRKSERRNSSQDGDYYVTKVGNKYLTINKSKDGKLQDILVHKQPHPQGNYHLTKTSYGSGDYVFVSEDSCNDFLKAGRLSLEISEQFRFGNSNYSLTQLEQVAKILGIETE